MAILVKNNNQWLPIKNIYSYQNNQWKTIKQCYAKQAGIWQNVWQNAIIFINELSLSSINIFELMGSPNKSGNYIFINNAEIIANNGEPAIVTGIFPQDSKLSIINNSYIKGYGGNGGTRNSNGQNGGTAIHIEMPCYIDNTNGYIYGGGGGSGGISVLTNSLNILRNYYMGGAGGAPNGEVTETFSRTSTGYYDQYEFTDPKNQSGGNAKIRLYAANAGLLLRNIEFITGDGGSYGEQGNTAEIIKNIPSGITGSANTATVIIPDAGKAGLSINKNGFKITLINSDPERIKGKIL